MNYSMGDRVIIRIDAESQQNELLQLVDGQEAVITEIYQNNYEPEVDRYEVELTKPVLYKNEEVVVIPGLYNDNIELIKNIHEKYIGSFSELNSLNILKANV